MGHSLLLCDTQIFYTSFAIFVILRNHSLTQCIIPVYFARLSPRDGFDARYSHKNNPHSGKVANTTEVIWLNTNPSSSAAESRHIELIALGGTIGVGLFMGPA
jgi:hypothetical protein